MDKEIPQHSEQVFIPVFHDSLNHFRKENKYSIEEAVYRFYEQNDFHPVWTNYYEPTPLAYQLLELFENSGKYGLNSDFYKIRELKVRLNGLNESPGLELLENKIVFENSLTRNALVFVSHLKNGIIYTDSMLVIPDSGYWNAMADHLFYSLGNEFINNILKIQPVSETYIHLQAGLEKFLSTHELTDEKIELPDFRKDSFACKARAGKILMENGFIDRADYSDSLFIEMLKNFQQYNGLARDGKLGKNTVKALQMNNRQRFEIAALNLERMRREKPMPANYITVNIPGFSLQLVQNNKIQGMYRVIVGHPSTPTPFITSQITEIVVFPEWYVPNSIVNKEIIPHLKNDSSYLDRMNLQVYDNGNNLLAVDEINPNGRMFYRIQQKAGYSNSLGIVKFLFPNEHSVYLHDTPSKSLFNTEIRAYSHGCVRVEDPVNLAESLLQLQEKPELVKILNASIQKQKQQHFRLEHPFAIFIQYHTCEGDENNNLYFYGDIYDQDIQLVKQLNI